MLEIVKYPHPALRYASRPIEQIDDALRSTVREMFELMYDAQGIGLAANQVALPFRFFILNLTADPEQKDQEQVFINPEIVKRHSSTEDEEGCLSLPGLYAKVRRASGSASGPMTWRGTSSSRTSTTSSAGPCSTRPTTSTASSSSTTSSPPALRSAEEKIREFERVYLQAQREGVDPAG